MPDEKPEENIVHNTAEVVTGVLKAVPVYEDAVQPFAQEVGKALSTVGKTINLALSPIRGVIWGYERIGTFLEQRLERRFKDVPAARIISPSPTVAGPAIEALKFAGSEPLLREMFACLVASAMDTETAHLAHPAFVEILKQLSPDEAKVIQLFGQWDQFHAEVVNERHPRTGDVHAFFVCTLAVEAGCTRPDLVASYVDNLCRLGLLGRTAPDSLTRKMPVDPVRRNTVHMELRGQYAEPGEIWEAVSSRSTPLLVTEFGRAFYRVCVKELPA